MPVSPDGQIVLLPIGKPNESFLLNDRDIELIYILTGLPLYL